MSNAFILGFIASEIFLTDYTKETIKQKYGSIQDVDQFIHNEKQTLRTEMLKMGLEAKHLDLLYAVDDAHYRDEDTMIALIKSYQGCEAGNQYRDAFLENYAYFQKHRELDFERSFDINLMKAMALYRTRYVDVDGIVAHVFFKLIELKNVAIVLKADHYKINPETRLRQL